MIYTLRYCPQCQNKTLSFNGKNQYHCDRCGFTYYRNVAAAVAGILRCQGKIVFAVRGKDPNQGMLDLPGGFIDKGERAEAALRREVKEELGVELGALEYFGTETNIYEYRGVSYHTLDLYFLGELEEPPQPADEVEIAEIRLIAPEELNFSELAFSSTWYAMERYVARFVKQ